MNKERVVYSTKSYYALRAFLCVLPPFFSLVFLIIKIAQYINSDLFAVVGWILLCTLPFLFQKKYISLFSRNIELGFDYDKFTIAEYGRNPNIVSKETIIHWSDIQYYKCSFSSLKTFTLTIDSKIGVTKKYSFKDEKSQDQALAETSAFSLFFRYVWQYNLDKKPEDKISFERNFLSTKYGAITLYGLTLLAIAAFVTHFVLAPSSSMLSCMSVFIILGLLVKRQEDNKLYEKIDKLSSYYVNEIHKLEA